MFATVEAVKAEDPCPHGRPARLCDADCDAACGPDRDDDPPLDPDTDLGPVVDLDLVPGARLALACQAAGTVPALLTDAEMLDVVEGTEKLLRWAHGLRTRMLAGFADRHPTGTSAAPPGGDPSAAAPVSRWLPDEVGLTLGVSRLDALGEIAQAQRLAHVLPDTLDALEHGRIDLRRAEAIARATAVLPDDTARAVEATILPNAPDATLRQVRDRTRRAIARADPDGEHRRHRAARTERRISIRSLDDGMASLWFYGPADQIEAAWQMADRLARALDPQDPRTLDQRRFDLAVQILQGRLTVTDLDDIDTTVTSVLDTVTHDTPRRATNPEPTGPDTPDPAAPGLGAPGLGAPGLGAPGLGAQNSETSDPGAPMPTLPMPGGSGSGDHAGPGSSPATATATATATAAVLAGPSAARVPPEMLAEAVAQALAGKPDLHAAAQKPLIHVVVGIDTLLGDDRPAELLGHGPLDAHTARALAAGGVWKRLVTDPLSGTLLDHGRTTYHPPAALADHVRARDQICRGPQCTRRIRDLDHHQPWADGGLTSDLNLHGLCQHHHLLKDAPGWHVLAHPDRSLTWISPHGRRHTTAPYDYRPFTGTGASRHGYAPDGSEDGTGRSGPAPEPVARAAAARVAAARDDPAVRQRAEPDDEAPPF